MNELKEMMVHYSPQSPIAEAYRGIRTNIECANVDQKLKTLLVTSTIQGEGKTTTLCNITMTLADVGKRVLLIDCDLRRPKIHRFFGISNKEGLTDLLRECKEYKSFLHGGFHPNVEVLPAGNIPKNPSELVSSQALKELIETFKKEYDYILIDTPPIMPVTDALVMSGYIDGVILVCASGSVEIPLAKKAKQALQNVGANVVGVVLNKIPVKEKRYKKYYYYAASELPQTE